MEENLELVCQQFMNVLGEKEEEIDTLLMDIQSSFHASSYTLLATHGSFLHDFEQHTRALTPNYFIIWDIQVVDLVNMDKVLLLLLILK
jgi:hypothetical protein